VAKHGKLQKTFWGQMAAAAGGKGKTNEDKASEGKE